MMKIAAVLTVNFFLCLPLFFNTLDYYDGVIIDHALRSQDFSGVYNWWSEGAYHGFHIWTWIVEAITSLLPYSIAKRIVVYLSALFLLTSLNQLLAVFIPQNTFKKNLLLAGLIQLPLCVFFQSLVFAPMFFCLSMGFVGVSAFSRKDNLSWLIGLPSVLLGFSYFHALPFLAMTSALLLSNRFYSVNLLNTWTCYTWILHHSCYAGLFRWSDLS